MAIIGYDPEKEEVNNNQKIKNCFTLAIIMLVGMPLLALLLPYLLKPLIKSQYLTDAGGQHIINGYSVIAIFLTLGIIFTLLYLRRQLKKEAAKKIKELEKKQEEDDYEN